MSDLSSTQMIALLALPDAAETEKFIAAKAKEKQLSTLKQNADTVSQKSDERSELSTKKEIAKAAGVSHDTIAKVEKIALTG